MKINLALELLGYKFTFFQDVKLEKQKEIPSFNRDGLVNIQGGLVQTSSEKKDEKTAICLLFKDKELYLKKDLGQNCVYWRPVESRIKIVDPDPINTLIQDIHSQTQLLNSTKLEESRFDPLSKVENGDIIAWALYLRPGEIIDTSLGWKKFSKDQIDKLNIKRETRDYINKTYEGWVGEDVPF